MFFSSSIYKLLKERKNVTTSSGIFKIPKNGQGTMGNWNNCRLQNYYFKIFWVRTILKIIHLWMHCNHEDYIRSDRRYKIVRKSSSDHAKTGFLCGFGSTLLKCSLQFWLGRIRNFLCTPSYGSRTKAALYL
jgi:hypothetical protein